MPTSGQNDLPVSSLRAIIAANGRMICDNSQALPDLLRASCAGEPEKADLLLRAQQARVPADLIWYAAAPRADLGSRLVARLQAQQALSDEDALWAVTSWIDALDAQVPRPRLRPVPAALPDTTAGTASFVSLGSSPAAAPQTVSSNNTNVRETSSPTVKQQPTSARPSGLPNWAIGAIAVVFLLVLGGFIYITTGPPANATRAPGVVYNLPPGYKAPMRAMPRPRPMLHPVKTTP